MPFTAPTTRATDFLVTAAIWNAEHVDNFNTAVPHLVVRKTSDQSVTSSTVFVSDTALVLPVLASEIWWFKFNIIYSAVAAADIKFQWTFPASGEFITTFFITNASDVLQIQQIATTTTPTPNTVTGQGITTKIQVSVEGMFINSSTAGNVTLQWAQNASNGTGTIVHANSTLWGAHVA
jgi:hypothetical protein